STHSLDIMLSIDLLPPEIWAEIFIFYAHEQFDPCIALLYICKAFRDIIIASPPCWAAMSIPCSSDPDSASIPIIKSWIERSAASPLFISLNLEETDEQQVPLLLPSSTLLQNRNRFRELIIYEASEWNLWNLNHLWPAPNLLSFAFEQEDKSSFIPPLELLEFPLFLRNDPQAPKLVYLQLKHCRFDAPRCDLDNVQELSLTYCTSSVRGFRQTLKCTPNVLRIVLGPVGIDAEPEFETPDATKNNVTTVPARVLLKHVWSIMFHLENPSTPIVVNLATPSLTHLTLAATVDHISLDMIVKFLAQESMPLLYLGLTLIGSFSSARVALDLPRLSQLETLHVCVRYISFYPLSVKVHPALTEFKIQYEPPNSTRYWEELFESQSEYRVIGRTFPDR
ncbi:hypothetical protein M408DRAFT_72968, partial [Serendipita vermifera MAFF 305830]